MISLVWGLGGACLGAALGATTESVASGRRGASLGKLRAPSESFLRLQSGCSY